jgi:hypothetical protein
VSFSRPGRRRSEAAYAALGGTSPIPASSGQTVRHRHGRGGDRALNRAVHAIALVRMRSCPRTRAYVARCTSQGGAVCSCRSARPARWAVASVTLRRSLPTH